jgi:protein SCO1
MILDRLVVAVACLMLISSVGCNREVIPIEEYQVRGVIKEIPEEGNRLRVHHEKIPDYMDAMTMPFNTLDREAFSELTVGDTIAFTLYVADKESWIDQIVKVDPQPQPGEIPSVSSVRLVRDVEPLNVGDTLPNYPFTDQTGKAFNLDDFRGKVLVFTFIYTRCPIPDFCPRMSLHFRSAYEAIKNDPEAPTNWHLLSLSFDPAHDTPEVLTRYAEAYAYDPEKWTFGTGEIIEIDAITEQFGLAYSRSEVTPTEWDHTLRTVVVTPEGIIHKIHIGNYWKPEELVQDIKDAAAISTAKPE